MEPIRLLSDLIRIDSVNPKLDQNGAGESNLAAWLVNWCKERQIECATEEVKPGRSNFFAWVPGQREERVAFVGHLDTVPAPNWTHSPFEPRLVQQRLYGRGSCDCKGSIAAMLLALASVKKEKPRSTIVYVGTIDEEYQKEGSRALASGARRFEAAVIGEPTGLELVVAHKGAVRWRIETEGKAAHSSRPELGVNAIAAMAKIIAAIEETKTHLLAQAHPLVGSPALTVSLIEGGSDICTVPAKCSIFLDRRLIPGESPKQAVEDIEKIIQGVSIQAVVRSVLPAIEDPPMEARRGSKLVEVARTACKEVAGTGTPIGVPYGTDASQLSANGVDCIVVGPGNIAQAHTVDEYVEVSEVTRAFEIYRRIMLQY